MFPVEAAAGTIPHAAGLVGVPAPSVVARPVSVNEIAGHW